MRFLYSLVLSVIFLIGIVFAQRQGTEIRRAGDGGIGSGQPASAALSNAANNPNLVTNILGAGTAIVTSNNAGVFTITSSGLTNAPWTTNLAVGYDIGAAVSNLPNNSVANILPGNHTVTPVIAFTNAGVIRFPPLVLMNKTNITLNIFGTINGSSTLGTIMLITNSSRITINGHNSGVFLGSRQTNIATLIPTNVTWALIAYYHCDNLTFKDFYLTNAHYHGLADWGGAFGTINSTNNILFSGLDISYTGSKMTNNSITWDGAALMFTGGTVQDCYFHDNFRGVEVYSDFANTRVSKCIIQRNRILNSLDHPFTTASSTNVDKIQILDNWIYQTKGYTRDNSNYLGQGDSAILLDGGHDHIIRGNQLYGTNSVGINLQNKAGWNIVVENNYIDGAGIPITFGGLSASFQGQFRYMVCRNNTAINTLGGYLFNSCRDGIVANNTASEFRAPFAVGFDFIPTQPNTNIIVSGNMVRDAAGFMWKSYSVYANNSRIIFSGNDGTNGTSGLFIDNGAGNELIYRGQRNDRGEIQFSETTAVQEGRGNSNAIVGGLTFYADVSFTNHSSAGLNYTNLNGVMLSTNALANRGDSTLARWGGNFRGANNGTNQLIVGFGTDTNIFDTGQFTNVAGVAWDLRVKIWRKDANTIRVYGFFELGGPTTITGGFTNQVKISTPSLATTNYIRLQARGFGAGAITNDLFETYHQPAVSAL